MGISIPNLSLVILIGPSGSGKSTFARKHFRPTEILSSDVCRGILSNDENDQNVTNEALWKASRLIRGYRHKAEYWRQLQQHRESSRMNHNTL